jgi:hypothetical protein
MSVALITCAIILGTKSFYVFLTQFDYFSIKDVDIQGVRFVDKKTLDVYCNTLKYNNIFTTKFRELDDFDSEWVKRVTFKKIYPDKIIVYVYERNPLFRVKSASGCYYLTDDLIRIKSDCENVNVVVKEPIPDKLLLNFAEIYKNFGKDFTQIELFATYFKAHKENTTLIGTYNRGFLRNYNAFRNKIAKLYKNIERVDLRIDGKIYVKGALNGA